MVVQNEQLTWPVLEIQPEEKELLMPRPPVPLARWAEDNYILPKETAEYHGRWSNERSPWILKAFELLHKINRRLHLTVVGDGPDFIEFEKICKTKRLTKYISLLGMIKNKDKLKEIYKKMDIFIFSSHREGFPRVLYEAMTFGLPIVTTFVGAVGSVMEDGKNCLRVKKQNPNDLGEKIWQLICDEKLREKIGKGATDTILQLFNEFERNSHAKQVIQWMQKTENYLN